MKCHAPPARKHPNGCVVDEVVIVECVYDEHSAAVMVAKLVTSVHEFPTTFTKVFWGGAAILHTHGVVALHEAEMVVALL